MVARSGKRSSIRRAVLGALALVLVIGGWASRDRGHDLGLQGRLGLQFKPQKKAGRFGISRSLARRLSTPALPEVQTSSKKLRANPATARGASAVRVEVNSSYLSNTESSESKWGGIPGVTASGDVLPESRFYKNAATSGDWITQIGLAQRDFESREAHGLVGAFEQKEQADRMAGYASQIGNEVVAYHVGYQRRRAARAAEQLIDKNSEAYRVLSVPVGGAIAVAAWGSGTPVEFSLLEGVKLRNETVLLGKSTRVALSSRLINSDFRIDFSNPEWSWYGASLSRGLLVDGLSAKLSSVRPVSSDQVWAGQGPVSEDSLAVEYRIQF